MPPTRGEHHVGPSVVVHVGGGDAHAVAERGRWPRPDRPSAFGLGPSGQARLPGARSPVPGCCRADSRTDVGELPGAVVAIERGESSAAAAREQAVHDQQVLVAVVVVVEERRARAHRLGQQLAAGGAVVVAGGDPRLTRDVGERDARRGTLRGEGDGRESEHHDGGGATAHGSVAARCPSGPDRDHAIRSRRSDAGLGQPGAPATALASFRHSGIAASGIAAFRYSGSTRPLRTAKSTSSAALCTPRVLIRLARCTATVFTERLSSAAISLFDLPWAMSCSTCFSRCVS